MCRTACCEWSREGGRDPGILDRLDRPGASWDIAQGSLRSPQGGSLRSPRDPELAPGFINFLSRGKCLPKDMDPQQPPSFGAARLPPRHRQHRHQHRRHHQHRQPPQISLSLMGTSLKMKRPPHALDTHTKEADIVVHTGKVGSSF